jgi:hypothetical protein
MEGANMSSKRDNQLDKIIHLHNLDDTKKGKLCDLVEKYEHETDDELSRKRDIFCGHIVAHTKEEIAEGAKDRSFNNAAYEGLSLIIRDRQRNQSKRESLKFWLQWFGFAGRFYWG